MGDLDRLLGGVVKKDLHSNLKLTPARLVDLERILLDCLHRLWERGVELENYFLDEIRDIIIIVKAAYIAGPSINQSSFRGILMGKY